MQKYQSLQKIRYLSRIPKGSSVATNFNLVPHLSHRKYIFQWTPGVSSGKIAEYIVLDTNLYPFLEQKDYNITSDLEDVYKDGYKEIFSDNKKTFFIFRKS